MTLQLSHLNKTEICLFLDVAGYKTGISSKKRIDQAKKTLKEKGLIWKPDDSIYLELTDKGRDIILDFEQ